MFEQWALISVSNKDGIVPFAKKLIELGYKLLSSGGTAKTLKAAGLEVMDVAELTGFPPMLGHRVVTLHPKVYGGLLARLVNPADRADAVKFGLPYIDLVCCDFYPLQAAIAKPGATIESVVEETDIGGPNMVRAAAKGNRIVICRVQDRQFVLDTIAKHGHVPNDIRQQLRARAEYGVAEYAGASAVFHGNGQFASIFGERVVQIPKGENGHQSPAALFSTGTNDPLALDKFQVVEGQALSYNNITDLERLLQTLTHIGVSWSFNFSGKAPLIAVGVKHGNPCGAAVGDFPPTVLDKMARGDSRAMFGGSVMTNFVLTEEAADMLVNAGMRGPLTTQKFDSVIAPGFAPGARELLARKGGKCRMVVNPDLTGVPMLDSAVRFRYVRGGFLMEPNYTKLLYKGDNEIQIFGPAPTKSALMDIILGKAVCDTSNSNTITIVRNGMLLGNGVGQQDRVGAAELAIKRAIDAGHGKPVDIFSFSAGAVRKLMARVRRLKMKYNPIEIAKAAVESAISAGQKGRLECAVAVSDSFFPFPDAVEVLINAGIRVIFSTSGSIKDGIIQKLCEDRGVTLVQLPDAKARGFFGH